MSANWSLILNVLLLVGVVIAIGRLMKARRQNFNTIKMSPVLDKMETKIFDDIIAVRKIPADFSEENTSTETTLSGAAQKRSDNAVMLEDTESDGVKDNAGQTLMLFLLAKENRSLAGYELLQTVLAAGSRFGEGHLFHRHQYPNGQGPILCSLASATATGVFDLQNIGAFSVRGLCLFMKSSGSVSIDEERLSVMLETARQLSEDLDTHLLDEQQRPFNEATVARFCQRLNIKESQVFTECV